MSYLIKIPECWREGGGGWVRVVCGVEGEEWREGEEGRWKGGADGERETGDALSMHGSRKK